MKNRQFSRRQAAMICAAGTLFPVLSGSHQAAADYPPTDGQMQGFVLMEERKIAPNVTFFDGDGTQHRFADFKGSVLLVNFWATWCAPCIREMPSLARLHDHFDGTAFRLLTLNQDRGGKQVAEPFIRERLNLPRLELFYDKHLATLHAFGGRGLPSTYLIDAQGRIVGGLTGPAEWHGDDAIRLINHVLAEQDRPQDG